MSPSHIYNTWSVDEIWDTLFPTTQKKKQNICDPAYSKRHNSGMLHGKNISGDITA